MYTSLQDWRRSSCWFVANTKNRSKLWLSESYCGNCSFFFVRTNERVICISDSDRGFAWSFRFAARCRRTGRFKSLIGGSWLKTAIDAMATDVATIECGAIVVFDSSGISERHWRISLILGFGAWLWSPTRWQIVLVIVYTLALHFCFLHCVHRQYTLFSWSTSFNIIKARFQSELICHFQF